MSVHACAGGAAEQFVAHSLNELTRASRASAVLQVHMRRHDKARAFKCESVLLLWSIILLGLLRCRWKQWG